MNDLCKPRLGVELHHVASVVVREEDRSVLAGNRTVGVVAFPRPHDLPALTGFDDARNRNRDRRRGGRRRLRAAAAADAERFSRLAALSQNLRQPGVLPCLETLSAREGGGRALSVSD